MKIKYKINYSINNLKMIVMIILYKNYIIKYKIIKWIIHIVLLL